MTKAAFFNECIDNIFSLMVTGNFIIENYCHRNAFEFYEDLIVTYDGLSRFYDKIQQEKKYSEEEIDVRLNMAINIAKQRNIERFLNRFNEVLKEKNINFNLQEDFEKYYKSANTRKEILDVYNKIILDLRAYEEKNLGKEE